MIPPKGKIDKSSKNDYTDFNSTMEVVLSAENFESEVLKSPLPVLVDFWADWCMPCHAIAPAIAEIANTYQDRLMVGKLDVDQHPTIASKFGVRSIPNLKIFKNGRIAEEIIGAVPKNEIIKRLVKHL